MRFDFTAEQQLFAENLRRTLEKLPRATDNMVAGTAEEAQPRFAATAGILAELGVFAVLAPEKCGGLELGMVDALLVAIECGRAQLPFPAAEAMLAAHAVCLARPHEADALIAGQKIATVATGGAVQIDAARQRVAGTLTVPYAEDAGWIVAPVGNKPGSALVIDTKAAGVTVTAKPSLDLTCRIAEVEVATALVGSDVIAFDIATPLTLLAGGDMLGVAQACLAKTTRYLKERMQFGTVIGRNQSLKHLAADDLLMTESMGLALEYAAWAHDAAHAGKLARAEFDLALHVAKAHVGPAAKKVVEDAIQMHGGVAPRDRPGHRL
jgi:alkylation response protein AidB-like acyl-CoA dehydrogenase